jgi:hypothetical protein
MGEDKSSAEVVDRKNGFYWVRTTYLDIWSVAEWSDGVWLTTGWSDRWNDSDLYEIDERQICRS